MNIRVNYGPGFAAQDSESLLVVTAQGVAFNVPDKTPEVIRARIERLKDRMLAVPSKVDLTAEHTLIDGVYTRTLRIPKGTVVVGKIHLKECVNIVAKGDISVLTETGAGRFQAGHVAVSSPGIQKMVYTHEDTVFINVFRTDETNIDRIEAEIATEDYEMIPLLKSSGRLACALPEVAP